ncbi:SWEET sugar transporter [Dillenia turbinata]|uniref:Bidirectional sugar transporter SWEET n=1 Tax=Dillenia turbinata TaxID=194707 RepID=A0AAN8V153_9MAGN
MGMFSIHHPLVFVFGPLGNIISGMVYLAPLPTFVRICKKKSTEGFHSIPYVIALFSAMVWLYYAVVKSGVYLIFTINAIGCLIETIYIALFFAYAPKNARIQTLKLLGFLNFGGFFWIFLLTHFLFKGSSRIRVLGWICVAFSVSVFAAPLSIIRQVIRTKSIEFMPFSLSFFLTLSVVMWFFYGILLMDLYIALPNTLGFLFGMVQMVLYVYYKNNKKLTEEQKLPEHVDVAKVSTLSTSEGHPVSSSPPNSDTQPNQVQPSEDAN